MLRIFRNDAPVRLVALAVLIAVGLTTEAGSSQDQIARLIAAARAQIGVTRYYDSSYTGFASMRGRTSQEQFRPSAVLQHSAMMWLRKCGQVVSLSSIAWLGEEAVLEFEGREVAQGRMKALRIVEGLDVVKEQGLSVL
jgi:hypothetical protein